jgi:hypothetical protein
MINKLKAALLTFFKYVFWTGLAAAAVAGADKLGGLSLPDYVIPMLGAALKSLATYATTEAGKR